MAAIRLASALVAACALGLQPVALEAQGQPLNAPASMPGDAGLKLPRLDKAAPDFTLRVLSDPAAPSFRFVSLAGLRGHAVVLDFWYSGCRPCIAELPHMEQVARQFTPRGVVFLAVDVLEPEVVAWDSWRRHGNALLTPLLAGNTLAKPYGLVAYPKLVLVDSSGVVRRVANNFWPENADSSSAWLAALLEAPARARTPLKLSPPPRPSR